MPLDAIANFAVSTVASPAPGTTAPTATIKVQSGHGVRFPTAPFNAAVHPVGVTPEPSNTEIVRVTSRTGDSLTVERHAEATTTQNIAVGWAIYAGYTAKTILDLAVTGFTADGGDGSLDAEDYGLTIDFGTASNYARLIPRGDTAANLASLNPMLKPKEMVWETDTLKVKVCPGSGSETAWNSLPYWQSLPITLSEADGRYLHLENGPVLVKGTPAANKIVKALSSSAAEWTSGGAGGGIDEAAFERLLAEKGIVADAPFHLTGTTASATNLLPMLASANASGTGSWVDARTFIKTFAPSLLSHVTLSTAGTKALGNNVWYLCSTGSAGATLELPTGIELGGIVIVQNASGGTIKIKGHLETTGSETLELIRPEVVVMEQRGEAGLAVWSIIGGYRPDASIRSLLVQPLKPASDTVAALAMRNFSSTQSHAVEEHQSSSGTIQWKREPDGSFVFVNAGTLPIRITVNNSDLTPRWQISNQGVMTWGAGTSGAESLDAKLERGGLRGSKSTLASNAYEALGNLGNGLVPGAFVGATSGSKAPTSGTYAVGDWAVDGTNGTLWICMIAGTPGTWMNVSNMDPYTRGIAECLGQSFDMPTTGAEVVNGVVYLAKVVIRGELTISEILAEMTAEASPASGFETGKCWAGVIAGENIYQKPTSAWELVPAGTLLGKTADEAAAWAAVKPGTTGALAMVLRDEANTKNEKVTIRGLSQGLKEPAFLHIALLCNHSGTPPKFACAQFAGKNRDINIKVTDSGTKRVGLRAGRAESGATTLHAIGAAGIYSVTGYKLKENDPLFWMGIA